MKRAYKYKLQPTVWQQRLLSQHFGLCRFIRNFGLNLQSQVAKENKFPEVTGINMDGEGNVVRHPVKRQDNKLCELSVVG